MPHLRLAVAASAAVLTPFSLASCSGSSSADEVETVDAAEFASGDSTVFRLEQDGTSCTLTAGEESRTTSVNCVLPLDDEGVRNSRIRRPPERRQGIPPHRRTRGENRRGFRHHPSSRPSDRGRRDHLHGHRSRRRGLLPRGRHLLLRRRQLHLVGLAHPLDRYRRHLRRRRTGTVLQSPGHRGDRHRGCRRLRHRCRCLQLLPVQPEAPGKLRKYPFPRHRRMAVRQRHQDGRIEPGNPMFRCNQDHRTIVIQGR